MQCRFSTTWIPRVCQFPPLQRDKSTWVPFKHAGELTWLIATCKLRRSRCSASPKVVRGFGIFRGEPSERRERVFGADDYGPDLPHRGGFLPQPAEPTDSSAMERDSGAVRPTLHSLHYSPIEADVARLKRSRAALDRSLFACAGMRIFT